MFKQLRAYALVPVDYPTLPVVERALALAPFAPCGPTQEQSVGWAPARNQPNAPLIESVNGEWILRFVQESKSVPASALRREVDSRCAVIEKETGRRPGRKEKKEITDEVKLTLLPRAFPKQSATLVWIDRARCRLIIGSAGQRTSDSVVSLLMESLLPVLPGFGVQPLTTVEAPSSRMTAWTTEYEAPKGFDIDRELELQAFDESRAKIKYSRHNLDIDAVKQHIKEGMLPVNLAMTWEGQVSFTLGADMGLKKIEYIIPDDAQAKADTEIDSFDANITISTGSLAPLLDDLIAALGGAVPLI